MGYQRLEVGPGSRCYPWTTRLRVTLRQVVPTVQRVTDVPAVITLGELHDVLQVAVGWTDMHLHQFRTDTQRFVANLDQHVGNDDEVIETGVRLSTLPARFDYDDDFGDGWEHDIEVLGRAPTRPVASREKGRARPRIAVARTGSPRCWRPWRSRGTTTARPCASR